MSTDLDALLGLALDLAQEAGRLLLDRRRGDLAVSTKSTPTDVVTDADTAAEALLARRLTKARPDDGLLGEEGTGRDGTSGLRWVVDPLDGTVNYLYGLPHWAVSVAVEDVSGALVGVVHAPVLRETYWATRGGGAFRDASPIRVSACSDPAFALLGTGFNYDARRRVTQAAWVARVLPQIRDIRRLGSAALDLCGVADGRLDAFAEQGLSPWDGAAGGLVAAEAGAVVSGLRGRPPSRQLYLASTPGLWAALHDLLVEVDADFDPVADGG